MPGWGGGRPSRQAKLPMLSPAAGRSAAAMGGRRSRLPSLGMTQRWMKSCAAAVDGRGPQDVPSYRSPSVLLSGGAHVFPGKRAPCVSTDAFEDSLHGTRGDRSCPDPPFLPWRAVPEPCRRGGGPRCDLAGQLVWSPARADGLSQAHPLPCPLPKPKSNYPSRRLSRPPQTQTIPLAGTDKQPQPGFL